MSKQKTSKTGSNKPAANTGTGSKLTKAELETIALEFREELKQITEGQQLFQASSGQEMEALKTSLGRMKQSLADFDSRWNINEKQIQTLGEMAALTQQRLDRELAVLGDRPWEKIGEELQQVVRTSAEKITDLEASLQKHLADLTQSARDTAQSLDALEGRVAEQAASKTNDLEASLQKHLAGLTQSAQDTAQRLAALDGRVTEQAASQPIDREQDILALGRRLDARLTSVERALADRTASAEERLAALEKERAVIAHKLEELRETMHKPSPAPEALAAPEPAAPAEEQSPPVTDVSPKPEKSAQAMHEPSPAPETTAAPEPATSAEEQSPPVADAAPKPEKRAQEWLHQARMLWNGQCFTDPHAATDYLTRALEIAPEDPELLNERGLAMIDAGFTDKAIAEFSKAIYQDATYSPAFHNRGLLYMQMEKRDLACRDFRSAASLGDSRALRMAQETGYCGGSVFKKLFRGVLN